ncbi:MAG: sugar ABC transporter substrate-binding protein [Anaerolineae bacterium]|nr:sugar ABC transporter substrate-binding protein [Anaerolineae bacterium]
MKNNLSRRNFIKAVGASAAAIGVGAALNSYSPVNAAPVLHTARRRQQDGKLHMAFIQFMPHTVPAAWSKGIEEVLTIQENVTYELLDGQGRPDVQISLMENLINQGASAIFLQPVDSVALGPSIAAARDAGIPVITLNIDAVEPHAVHVEMNHYFGAVAIGEKMGELMGGKGKVAILNAPPGIIIRDQRTNGFMAGIAKYPDIQVVADQSADWDRKKAQDVLSAMLAATPDITGVYGVNDSMALGAVDVAKSNNMLDKMVIFGNDGEVAAIESIEAGELTGTQYTDVYQQGRFAASVATALATGGVPATAFAKQGHILMPYIIATKENASSIQPSQRW